MHLASEQNQSVDAMDQGSFRDRLAFAIGFAISRSRDLLRRIVRQHAPDDARQLLPQQVVRHVEQSGVEIDETARRLLEVRIRAERLASPVGELRQRGETARATSRPSPD